MIAASVSAGSDRHDVMSKRLLANIRRWIVESAQRGRLARNVHFTSIPMWTCRCRMLLLQLAAPLQQQPMHEPTVATWVCALMMLPYEMFTMPSRAGGGARRRKSNFQRLRHKLRDDDLIRRLIARASDLAQATEEQRGAWTAMTEMLVPDSDSDADCRADSSSAGSSPVHDSWSTTDCSDADSDGTRERELHIVPGDSDADAPTDSPAARAAAAVCERDAAAVLRAQ